MTGKKEIKKEEKEKKDKKIIYYEGYRLRNIIKFFKNKKHTFTVKVTGYTASIKNETTGDNLFFIKSRNKANFSIVSKIKSDILNSNLHVDKVVSSRVKYFRVNELKNNYFKTVYNVDINSAYPTGLLKQGFITKKTFDLLMNLEKIERLKAIGQIATRSTMYKYTDGEMLEKPLIVENELMRSVWFALCFDVGEVIDAAREQLSSFLFFWFDGIYFSDINEAQKTVDLITNLGYECKFEVLKNFKTIDDNRNIYINYEKENEKKQFTIPKTEKMQYG